MKWFSILILKIYTKELKRITFSTNTDARVWPLFYHPSWSDDSLLAMSQQTLKERHIARLLEYLYVVVLCRTGSKDSNRQ
jgi:hypothetical protein